MLSFLSMTHLLYILLRIEITTAFARKVGVVEATADKALFPAAACSYGNWQHLQSRLATICNYHRPLSVVMADC